jgi:uncharacterized protein (DUF1501 family)
MTNYSRRGFLGSGLAGAGALVTSRLAFAAAPTDARFVLVILRGALDGLAAVPPIGDPDYAALRGQIALAKSGENAALPLAGQSLFGLHPALGFLHECYRAREATLVHALATPYRDRSHFDAQDVLESGVARPHGTTSGWLNRALAALPAPRASGGEGGVALGANIPLVLRGAVNVASWSPTRIAALNDETLARVTDLYAADPLLARRLADALSSDAIAQEAQRAANAEEDDMTPAMGAVEREQAERRNAGARHAEVARAAAGFLKRPEGPRIAVFDTGGWDTHANEGGAQGALAFRLRALDAGLRAFKEALGPAWRHTVMLVATEFGRTVAVNGTRGTDHGTGAAAFLLGGAVAGGRVMADWPGLARADLLDGRDLKPTLDFRVLAKSLLRDHLGVAPRALEREVFPGSEGTRYLEGLVRAV